MLDEREAEEQQDGAEPEPQVTGGGLAERMRRRAQELADQHSEVFPVPGYASMLAVELRALSMESTSRIAQRHERTRDPALRNLYIAADVVLSATEQFFQVDRDGKQEPIEATWHSLAVSVKDVAADTTPRQAILALLGGVHVAMLAREWDEWMASEREETDEEMVLDFKTTR